jgi:hypothetical protein
MYAAVIVNYGDCNSARMYQLFMTSINPIIIPVPVYCHSITKVKIDARNMTKNFAVFENLTAANVKGTVF